MSEKPITSNLDVELSPSSPSPTITTADDAAASETVRIVEATPNSEPKSCPGPSNDATNAPSSPKPRRSSKDLNDPPKDSSDQENTSRVRRTSPTRRRRASSPDQAVSESSGQFPTEEKHPEDTKSLPKSQESSTTPEPPGEETRPSPAVPDAQGDPDDSELGIVGPPTTVNDVLNDEELLDPSKNDSKVDSQVAEWIERSSSQQNTQDPKNSIKSVTKDLTTHQPTRKSQRIVTSIIKRSIKCLNKMHAMDCATTSPGNGKNINDKKDNDIVENSPKVPQNRQNGAALPEETTTAVSAGRVKIERHVVSGARVKKENHSDIEDIPEVVRKKTRTSVKDTVRKRRSTEDAFSTNGNPKRICFEQRERFIDSLVGSERISADELASRADELRAEVQALDELAKAKEMEWNEILSMRKLKEEAYLRVERRRQVMGFLESNNGQMSDNLPPASLSLLPEWEQLPRDLSQDRRGVLDPSSPPETMIEDRLTSRSRLDPCRDDSQTADDDIPKRDDEESTNPNQKSLRVRSGSSSKLVNESGRRQRRSVEQNLENRHIGEGRQGPIVDVRSIIADHRLRHPETVPRRGRRMRNSVNINLGAGGAMVETTHGDSRASSTDSCKSNTNPNDAMSFKDVLVQFAKLSQQQGEPVKTPQNYPDVTLHPVAPSPLPMNSSQPTGSLLHGILTKSQSPRPTTFSPTLARLLTAPERERSTPPSGSIAQQSTQAQHLLQTYQGSNPVSISDLLSSSKARTEITITPVVNPPIQSSHSNNIVHVDDGEEENSLVEERETRRNARENREDRDSPPRCQGCHERAAQFVCAGCGNQWYCSRECQVSAWDEHSEVCSG